MVFKGKSGARAALLGALAALAAGFGQAAAAARPLTVVELFQSQGCSSCPPANANINALADRPDLLVLSYGVTYWDNLGWKDTFASPRNTARQWAYARGLGHSNVGTPQVVLNGRQDLVGTSRPGLEAAIRSAAPSAAVEVVVAGDEVQVRGPASKAQPADVWLVRYDPRVEWVPIRRGENGGRTLPHRNIVKQFVRLGRWTGGAGAYRLTTATDPALSTAILVQVEDGGPVLGAAKL